MLYIWLFSIRFPSHAFEDDKKKPEQFCCVEYNVMELHVNFFFLLLFPKKEEEEKNWS